MAKLLSGTRIYGTATVDTQLFVSGSNAASSTITGALQVVGGIGVGLGGFFGGNVTATNFIGNLTGIATTASLATTATNIAGGGAGSLPYQTSAGTTTMLSLGANGYILTAGATAPQWTAISGLSAGNATTSTNLAGGTAGQTPYQTSAGITSFYGPGTLGQLLMSSGTSAPQYVSTASINVGRSDLAITATNLALGTAGQLHYQSAPGVTAFAGPGTSGQLLMSSGTSAPQYVSTASINVGRSDLSTTSTNIVGGAGGSIPYQSGSGATAMLGIATTAGYVLSSTGSLPQWSSLTSLGAGSATTATNIAAGLAGQLLYQTAPGATGFVTTAATGYILSSNGSSAPSYVAQSTLSVGTATVATKWSTARTVSFSGDTTGTFTIDGSADVTGVNITIQPNSVALGTDTTGDYVSNGATAGFGLSGSTTGETQTFTVTSNATSSNTISTIVYRDTSGNFSAGTITASLTGTATTATNVAGGAAGSVHYQSAAGVTAMLSLGTNGYVLTAGATAPQWTSISGLGAGTATTATNVTVTNDVATNTPQYITFVSTSTGGTGIKTAATSGLTFIPSSGYHGIGIDIPTAPLHIVTSVNSVLKFRGASTGQIGILYSDATQAALTNNAGSETYAILPATNALAMSTNATNRITVDLNGQVKVLANIESTAVSTGSLVVTGGVGISSNLYVGGLINGGNGARITGTVTATTFVGNLTGNASGTAGALSGGAAGSLPYQTGSGTTGFLAIGTAGYFLTVNAGATAPQWTQTLGVANGGTGVTTLTGVAYGNGTSAFTAATGAQISTALGSTNITGNAANVTGTVLTSNGGTGLTSWTAGDLPYYASGTALTKLAIGTSGYVLTSSGSAPQWSLASGLSAGSSASATNIAGGNTNQIPYQSGVGATAFSANLTWVNSSNTFGVTGTIAATGALTRGGAISSSAWTTTSPVFHNAGTLLTDTSSGAGTVSARVGVSLHSPNFAASNAITITDAVNLYLQAPVASTNVTFTNNWGLYNQGNTYLNGNVGIGRTTTNAKVDIFQENSFNATTPGTTTGYGIHLSGQATADYATGITFSAGGASAGNANAGIYSQGSGSYGTKLYLATTDSYATGAKTRLMIDQAGNVGINIISPAAKLHLVNSSASSVGSVPGGVSAIIDSNTNNYLLFRNTADNGTYSGIAFQDNNIGGYVLFGNAGGAGDQLWIGGYGGGSLQSGTSNTIDRTARTTYLTWSDSGVGITSGPLTLNNNRLYFAGVNDNNHALNYPGGTFNSQTNGTQFRWYNYLNLYSTSGGISVMHLNDSGNVGINTTTPAARLHVSGNAIISGNAVIGATTTTNKFEVVGTAGQLFSVSDSFAGTIFSANDVSGMPSIEVLDTGLVKLAQYGGQVAISTGTVASGSALTVNGIISTIGTGGEIRASSEVTAYYSSDARLKENVTIISNPIEMLNQIRGVYFDWTDKHIEERGGEDGVFVRKHDVGVIAQEVEAILPEIVTTRDNGYKAVRYEKIVPLLIEAIKEQQNTINSLVNKLQDVEELINILKNKQ